MCGITGFLRQTAEDPALIIKSMTRSLTHRGPDTQDIWVDKTNHIALGHTRLSVIDLSLAGNQPMLSQSGRWVLVYNGEVYNTEELKKDLSHHGIILKGHSDTEVILEAFSLWGIESILPRLIGMFALALWDRKNHQLILARDPLGVKPLYWAQAGGGYLFSSELKAFSSYPHWRPTLDSQALSSYMELGYVPSPLTIWENAYKLSPGCFLILSSTTEPLLRSYWSIKDVISKKEKKYSQKTEQEILLELENLLKDSVNKQMVSDVPLGAFLSGGIDSSLIVALMQQNSATPIKTFSIGFHEKNYNEASAAKTVANHLKTDHTELYLSPQDIINSIPSLLNLHDEPFADASQIPTYLVSRLARDQVTITLSGDGGDELFGGYNRYIYGEKIKNIFNKPWQKKIYQLMGQIGGGIPSSTWNFLSSLLGHKICELPLKIEKLINISKSTIQTEDDIYWNLVKNWKNLSEILINPSDPYPFDPAPPPLSFLERMQYYDTLTYLPDNILTKLDRASMAVSLESRVPFLDHRLVEFSWRLPNHLKIRDKKGKWLLRQLLKHSIPESIINRPKAGFTLPLDIWLKGPLKEWAWAYLCPEALSHAPFFKKNRIEKIWDEHQKGKRSHHNLLWSIIVFQQWQTHMSLK